MKCCSELRWPTRGGVLGAGNNVGGPRASAHERALLCALAHAAHWAVLQGHLHERFCGGDALSERRHPSRRGPLRPTPPSVRSSPVLAFASEGGGAFTPQMCAMHWLAAWGKGHLRQVKVEATCHPTRPGSTGVDGYGPRTADHQRPHWCAGTPLQNRLNLTPTPPT